MEIPKGHQVVMPYLMLEGAKRFIDFTKTVLGAELTYDSRREDSDDVMHAEIRIGDSTIMFSEATEQWKKQTANLFVYVPDADESYRSALNHGGTSVSPPADQDYGRSCGVTDPCGNVWWITSIK